MYKMCKFCDKEDINCSLEDLEEEEKQDLIITRCKNYKKKEQQEYMSERDLRHVFKLARDFNTDVVVQLKQEQIRANNNNLESVLEMLLNNRLEVVNAHMTVEVRT